MSNPVDLMLKGLEELRKVDPELPVQRAVVFLLVVRHEGCTAKQLQDWAGLSNASIVRNLQALGKTNRHGKPGHDLVVAKTDPTETRRNIVELTPKGRRVAESIKTLL